VIIFAVDKRLFINRPYIHPTPTAVGGGALKKAWLCIFTSIIVGLQQQQQQRTSTAFAQL